MNRLTMIRGLSALGFALAFNACAESLSLDATGELAMTMQRAGSGLLAPQQSESQNRAVAPDTVDAFFVTVAAVQVQHSHGDSASAGTWSTMQLRTPVRVNLMALGTSDDSARVIARGRVEGGSYARVRLILTNPTIRFKGDVSFGLGSILQGGVDYGVELAGGQEIEIEAAVDIEAGASSESAVALVFDQDASLGSVSVTGAGQVLLAAVIAER